MHVPLKYSNLMLNLLSVNVGVGVWYRVDPFHQTECFLFCFETESCYVSQATLQLIVLLPQPPKDWDDTCATTPNFSFYFSLNAEFPHSSQDFRTVSQEHAHLLLTLKDQIQQHSVILSHHTGPVLSFLVVWSWFCEICVDLRHCVVWRNIVTWRTWLFQLELGTTYRM